jgi:hypothetical protein
VEKEREERRKEGKKKGRKEAFRIFPSGADQ